LQGENSTAARLTGSRRGEKIPSVMREVARMLPFKRQPDIEAEPTRWTIGVDRRHVAAYVGLALIAGFTLGFLFGRVSSSVRNIPPSAKGVADAARTTESLSQEVRAPAPAQPPDYYRVNRVIGADTIEVDRVGLVRMIGVEIPDERKYPLNAQSARAFTEKSLAGQLVRLEFDPANAERGNKDSAGYRLAYVYKQDGSLFNAELIKQGYAFVRVSEPFKLVDDFRAFERDAMQAMRGVWGTSGSAVATAASPATENKKKLTPLLPSELDPKLPPPPAPAPSPGDVIVFVSLSDHMYHKAGCEYLGKKKQAIRLADARSAGYAACSRCFASTILKATDK
jgi:micrococcal nuclease